MLARRGIPLFRRLYGEEAVATRTLRPGRRSESFSRIACEAMGGEGAGAPDRARAGDGGGVTALGSYSRCQTARRIANSFVGWVERLRNPSMGFAPLRGPQPILRTIPARHLLSATSSPSFSFPSASRAEHFRFFHPGRGGGERRRALGCLRSTRFACHDRHAGASTEAPRVLSDENARLAALHRGDFRPVPVLPVVRDSLRGRAATLLAARVILPGGPGLLDLHAVRRIAGRGRHASLHIKTASRSAPR